MGGSVGRVDNGEEEKARRTVMSEGRRGSRTVVRSDGGGVGMDGGCKFAMRWDGRRVGERVGVDTHGTHTARDSVMSCTQATTCTA